MATLFFKQITALPEVVYGPGKIIIEEKNPTRGIYFMTKGTVEIHKEDRLIAEDSRVGAMFGEMSHLLTVLPTATVKTKTECHFRVCEHPTTFLMENPVVCLFIANNLAERLDALNKHHSSFKNEMKVRVKDLGIERQLQDILDGLSPH